MGGLMRVNGVRADHYYINFEVSSWSLFGSEVLIYKSNVGSQMMWAPSKTDTLELEWNLLLEILYTLHHVWEVSSSVRYLFHDCHL